MVTFEYPVLEFDILESTTGGYDYCAVVWSERYQEKLRMLGYISRELLEDRAALEAVLLSELHDCEDERRGRTADVVDFKYPILELDLDYSPEYRGYNYRAVAWSEQYQQKLKMVGFMSASLAEDPLALEVVLLSELHDREDERRGRTADVVDDTPTTLFGLPVVFTDIVPPDKLVITLGYSLVEPSEDMVTIIEAMVAESQEWKQRTQPHEPATVPVLRRDKRQAQPVA